MSFSHEFLLVNKISPQFPEFTGPFTFFFFDDWLLRLPSSPETEAVWLSSTETWRSWLDVCTTVWQSVSIHIPSPPSVLRLSHSWSLRWTSWEQAVRLWRRQMTNWVNLFFFFFLPPHIGLSSVRISRHTYLPLSLCASLSPTALCESTLCVLKEVIMSHEACTLLNSDVAAPYFARVCVCVCLKCWREYWISASSVFKYAWLI